MLRMGTWTERRFHSVPFSREKEAQSFEREQLITKPLSRGFSPSRPLSLSLSLSLCCCGRRVEENAGNEDCNVTEGILNCFTPSQEPVLLMQWRNVNIASRRSINHLSTKATTLQLLRACVPAVAVFSCIFSAF